MYEVYGQKRRKSPIVDMRLDINGFKVWALLFGGSHTGYVRTYPPGAIEIKSGREPDITMEIH